MVINEVEKIFVGAEKKLAFANRFYYNGFCDAERCRERKKKFCSIVLCK